MHAQGWGEMSKEGVVSSFGWMIKELKNTVANVAFICEYTKAIELYIVSAWIV